MDNNQAMDPKTSTEPLINRKF